MYMQAMCKRFTEHCQEHNISLSPKGFTLQYDTNIPRQAGLSGSSAIACAALNCLMQYYCIADRYRIAMRLMECPVLVGSDHLYALSNPEGNLCVNKSFCK